MPTMTELFSSCRVMPVVTLDDPATAVPVAEALYEGGLPIIEMMLRTPQALAALSAITRALPRMTVGAGTVLDAAQLQASVDAGARFIVAPGLTPRLLDAASRAQVPFLPGIASASELMLALEANLPVCKLFPAAIFGVPMLKALAGPFPAARFCATGGITTSNMQEFLAQPNVLTVGCSWIASAAAVAARDYAAIRKLAAEAKQLASS